MIKLKDVAKRAGVSEATASLVMNDRPGVNKQTRVRVLEAAKVLGYTPNHVARGLAMKKTHIIGLIVTDIENPFFASLTKYIHIYTKKVGYGLVFSVSNDDIDEEDEIIVDFIGKRLDGIIIIPSVNKRKDKTSFKKLDQLKIPYIFATSYYPGISNEYVMTDLSAGSYMLTKYLVENGHRDILFLTTQDTDTPPSKLRIAGYNKALRETGIGTDSERLVHCERPDYRCGYDAIISHTESHQPLPDAIIAINDVLALGAQHALIEKGFHVPTDVSVAGYDDVIFSCLSEIPLTTVKQDIQLIAKTAVEMIIGKINGKSRLAKRKKIKPELIIRKSTAQKKNIQGNSVKKPRCVTTKTTTRE